MRSIRIGMALALVPALLAAQQNADADAKARAQIDATVQAAVEKGLPAEPVLNIIAEGRAKGAAEGQIRAAAVRTVAQLEVAKQALVRAGREEPSDGEVARGASVIARGASSADLELLVRRAPSERRLEVAFEVLTELSDRGLPVGNAVIQIGSRLEAGASDGQLKALPVDLGVKVGAGAGVGVGVGRRGGN